jgi:hypothetical protein
MHYVLLISGIVILFLVLSDIINTTLTPHGGGKITLYFSRFSWKFYLYLNRNYGGKKLLNLSGTIITSQILVIWISLLWLGYFLVFAYDPASVVNSTTGQQAGLIDKLYYIGYTLSTLGYGDYQGGTPFWRVFSSIISFSGLILITIAITYLVPINSAEIEKRKLSIYITTLGASPQEILMNAWNGENFKALNDHFHELTDMIITTGQNNLAYPILYYFHTSNKNESGPLNICALDEALTILMYYIPDELQPDNHYIYPLRKSITVYINNLRIADISPNEEAPNLPDLSMLTRGEVPLKEEGELVQDFESLQKRRKLLKAMLKNDGWKWDEMVSPKYYDDFEV